MNKWEAQQFRDCVWRALISLLINKDKEWTTQELLNKTRTLMNVCAYLFEETKKLEDKTELPKIEEKKEPVADEDEWLVKEWEEKIEDKKREEEEMIDELKKEEAILKGRYNPPSLDL